LSVVFLEVSYEIVVTVDSCVRVRAAAVSRRGIDASDRSGWLLQGFLHLLHKLLPGRGLLRRLLCRLL